MSGTCTKGFKSRAPVLSENFYFHSVKISGFQVIGILGTSFVVRNTKTCDKIILGQIVFENDIIGENIFTML